MADLVEVKFKNGGVGKVSRDWVKRWPEDIAEVGGKPFKAPASTEEKPKAATSRSRKSASKKGEGAVSAASENQADTSTDDSAATDSADFAGGSDS